LNNNNTSIEDGSGEIGEQSSSSSIVSTTNTGSLVKTVFNTDQTTNEKNQTLSSNFNAQLSLKTAEAAAALAAKKTNYEKFAATRRLQDENHKKTLLLKMEVQQIFTEIIMFGSQVAIKKIRQIIGLEIF